MIRYETILVIHSWNTEENDMNDSRKKLLEELALVQNMPKNQERDIMTIAYMMDDTQLENHIKNCRSA